MAIATVVQRNALCTRYSTDNVFAALFTADPGGTGTVVGEVTGGTYARVSIVWGAASAGSITGTATLNVPTGTTITFAGSCTSGVATTADLRDKNAITSQTFSTAGTYALTITFSET